MVVVGLIDGQHLAIRRRIEHARRGVDRVLGDDGVTLRVGEVDVRQIEGRVERQAQQTLFVAGRRDPIRDVEHHRGRRAVGGRDRPGLFDHEHPVVIGSEGDVDGPRERADRLEADGWLDEGGGGGGRSGGCRGGRRDGGRFARGGSPGRRCAGVGRHARVARRNGRDGVARRDGLERLGGSDLVAAAARTTDGGQRQPGRDGQARDAGEPWSQRPHHCWPTRARPSWTTLTASRPSAV